jgi:ABC-type multidrug transport system ATPase subunit
MSEEILKALMQLFAIITKQDEGVTENEKAYVRLFLQSQLSKDQVSSYYSLYQSFLEDKMDSSDLKSSYEDKDRIRKREERRARQKQKQEDSSNLGILSDSQLEEEKLKIKAREERRKRREQLKQLERDREGENRNLTSVKDSVITLSICKKINSTLSQQQKVVVLVRLFELINSDEKFTSQRLEIIDTVSDVFNLDKTESSSIQTFIRHNSLQDIDVSEMLIIEGEIEPNIKKAKKLYSENLDGRLLILKVESVGLYFLKYEGSDELNLNGLILNTNRIYLFANGSTIRLPKGKPVYYSDVVSQFMTAKEISKLSFNAYGLEFMFPNGVMGLKSLDISEQHGKLIGIMGASGAGKTTLLSVLSGQSTPTNGSVRINNIDIHTGKDKIKGVFGYIPQDDLLLDDLTVFQNLYYNTRLCFSELSKNEITEKVQIILSGLGLWEIRHLKVGNIFQKTISGGQRKRLNIALELIREPSVLFVDEPTSGLSSRDSENVMDLLRELSLSGKLVFVVIHQPSSHIYKMFDKVFIMDVGGYPVYYGNPVESVIYFKTLDNQLNQDEGECSQCGNVNVELIFNIIESNIVDEYGQYTGVRKVSPEEWHDHYKEDNKNFERVEEVLSRPEGNLNLPSAIKQWLIFTTRDVLSKLANRQYILINCLEAPVLALILAFIIRYIDSFKLGYVFGRNDNIPAYLFMSIIVALFMGMTVSAEEIVRDKKILKRERFLNLNKLSYLFSKVGILFAISAIQTFSFVLIGNFILDIKGMYVDSWLVLFSVSCFANMLGLNISASFNSAVTIYILIPLLLIPQLVLSGAMFSFEKLNHYVGSDDKVPIIADLMVSRWAFEAIAVGQYKDNHYMHEFYEMEKKLSFSDFRQVYLMPELESRMDKLKEYTGSYDSGDILMLKQSLDNLKLASNDFSLRARLSYNKISVETLDSLDRYLTAKNLKDLDLQSNLDSLYSYIYVEDDEVLDRIKSYTKIIRRTLIDELALINKDTVYNLDFDLDGLKYENITWLKLESLSIVINQLKGFYSKEFIEANNDLSDKRYFIQENNEEAYRLWRNTYYNNELARLLKKTTSKRRVIEKNDKFIQQIDPIYRDPVPRYLFDYRAHFYAPRKNFFGNMLDTFVFNLIAIWLFSLILFIALSFDFFKLLIERFSLLIGKFKIKF